MRDSDLYASFKTHLAAIIARRPKADDIAPAAPPAAPSAADLEFERVRADALARQAAEKKAAAEAFAARQAAQTEKDAAVAMILDSRSL